MTQEQADVLTKAGWVRAGPFWKAPDDQGTSGRKWSIQLAYNEQLRRGTGEKPAAKPKGTSAARKKKADSVGGE